MDDDTVIEPPTPQYFRSQFPYSALPRAIFEPTDVPVRPAPVRWITDTTFRDGQQARQPFSPGQVRHLFGLLHRLDGGSGTIRASEFFIYTEEQRATVDQCRAAGYQFPAVTAWIRARVEDLRLVTALDLEETGILTSVSDHHIFNKLGLMRQAALDRYLEIVDAALEAGLRVRCHFEDVTRADVPGFVVPFAQALMEHGKQAGRPVTIRLCDTLGVALPWPAAGLPRGVPRLIHALTHDAGVPPTQIEWHGHNDGFKGHATAATAWLYGCAAINCTLLGLGERTGNTPLEAAILDHVGFTGESRLQLALLPEIAAYLRDNCGVQIPASYPLLGEESFTTRAGVHIDGLLKDPETYMAYDPQAVLGRPIRVVVSDKSGAAGIAWWINEQFGLAGPERVTKSHPGVGAMYSLLLARYARGVQDDPTDQELCLLARAALPELFPRPGEAGMR
jgi:isopropylmalate/homocitrate/citramalate synthase